MRGVSGAAKRLYAHTTDSDCISVPVAQASYGGRRP